jgi:hypothetical protein
VCTAAWSARQGCGRDHLAHLRVNQPCLVLLDIGHQQVLPAPVPGQAVGFLPGRNRSQDSIRSGIDHQKFARSACSREDQRVFLGTEHPTGLRTVRDGREVAQVLPIDNLNSAGCRIGDENAATLEVHVPMIEVTPDAVVGECTGAEPVCLPWLFSLYVKS